MTGWLSQLRKMPDLSRKIIPSFVSESQFGYIRDASSLIFEMSPDIFETSQQ